MTEFIIAFAVLSMISLSVILGIVWGVRISPPKTKIIIVDGDNEDDEDDDSPGDDDGNKPHDPDPDGPPLVDWEEFDRRWSEAEWDKEKI